MRILGEVVQVGYARHTCRIQEIRMQSCRVRRSDVEACISNVHCEVKVRVESQRVQECQITGSGRARYLYVVHRGEGQRTRHYLIGALVHQMHLRPRLNGDHIRNLRQFL